MKNFALFKILSSALILLSGFFLFVSCDKIEAPYTKDTGNTDTVACPVPQFSDRNVFQKHVLIEEFTGFKCVNCPRGHRMLDSLNNIYGSKLISFGIHVGFFAKPDASGDFAYDFRSADGNEIDKKFNIAALGLPEAMVDRVMHGNTRAAAPDNWGPYIDAQLTVNPVIDIQILNDYDAASQKLCVHTRVHALENLQKQVNLSVYLIEDSIKSSQLDINGVKLSDYYQRNVLRTSINGTWGIQLKDTLLKKDEFISKSYKYFINNAWNYKKMYIVAFVYYQDTYEIIQAEKIKLSY